MGAQVAGLLGWNGRRRTACAPIQLRPPITRLSDIRPPTSRLPPGASALQDLPPHIFYPLMAPTSARSGPQRVKNGLCFFSWPTVVSGPCPDASTVPLDKVRIFSTLLR